MLEPSDLRRELSEARTRIAQLEAELAEERRLSASATSAARDFSNVLAAIAGENDLMLRALAEPSSLRRGAESIKKAVEWGHRLTEQLLASSKRSTAGFCLPVVDVPPVREEGSPTAARAIVVLEDDPRVRDLIVEILESHDYRALRAATADEALGLSGRASDGVALVVAAVRALDGPPAEFADWLHAVAPGAMVLYLTDQPGGIEGAATLIKPFTVEALVEAVRRVLKTSATG